MSNNTIKVVAGVLGAVGSISSLVLTLLSPKLEGIEKVEMDNHIQEMINNSIKTLNAGNNGEVSE